MAKQSSNSQHKTISRNVRTNSPKPLIPKAGITHSGRRTYSNGGKV